MHHISRPHRGRRLLSSPDHRRCSGKASHKSTALEDRRLPLLTVLEQRQRSPGGRKGGVAALNPGISSAFPGQASPNIYFCRRQYTFPHYYALCIIKSSPIKPNPPLLPVSIRHITRAHQYSPGWARFPPRLFLESIIDCISSMSFITNCF